MMGRSLQVFLVLVTLATYSLPEITGAAVEPDGTALVRAGTPREGDDNPLELLTRLQRNTPCVPTTTNPSAWVCSGGALTITIGNCPITIGGIICCGANTELLACCPVEFYPIPCKSLSGSCYEIEIALHCKGYALEKGKPPPIVLARTAASPFSIASRFQHRTI